MDGIFIFIRIWVQLISIPAILHTGLYGALIRKHDQNHLFSLAYSYPAHICPDSFVQPEKRHCFMQKGNTVKTACYHCGDICTHKNYVQDDKYFCCSGCLAVYNILSKNELCTYYNLNRAPGITQKTKAGKDKFNFLDDETIASQLINYSDGRKQNILFYLPQIHCSSCLWLLENLPALDEGIISSRVNFTGKEVLIVFDKNKISLRHVVELLAAIGYEPHISLDNISAQKAGKLNRSRWYKLGIAGFCFANIMMMSLPAYFANGEKIGNGLDTLFAIIIIILSIPVFFYSASEFFRNAWYGIKNKYLNIDAPVALALIITYARSLYEIFSGTGNGYMDSMSGIVFFMLIGRWLQNRTNTAISFDRDYKSFFPVAVNKISGDKIISATLNTLKPNDVILVQKDGLVPADCILSKGKGVIDYSFVSGESMPVYISPGEMVYAGGRQTGSGIELLVIKEVSQSYLTALWNKNIFTKEEKPSGNVYDLIGKYFTYAVLLTGFIAGAYWYSRGMHDLMWNAFTTVLIVACPCALLLSSNYTKGNILRILGINKLYLRGHEVIDRMSEINAIVFDKTGTLTRSNKSSVTYSGKTMDDEIKYCLASLLGQSQHPVARSVYAYLNVKEAGMPDSFKETEAAGIECWIHEHHIKAGSASFAGGGNKTSAPGSSLHIMVDGIYFGMFSISNIYRNHIPALLKKLRSKYSLSILSGDNDAEYKNLSAMVGSSGNIFFNRKPGEKLEYIQSLQQQHKKTMVVGDGLNDAIAIKQSDIGIAVADGNSFFTPACDGIIDASALHRLDTMIAFAAGSRKVIIFSFTVSAVYNLIGLWFAVHGTLSPVIAAILMPCSSVTIIFLTYYLTSYSAWRKGLKTGLI